MLAEAGARVMLVARDPAAGAAVAGAIAGLLGGPLPGCRCGSR
ncbi:hypothetical protein ACFV1W_37355 [Kitasatospora sp. NPDC059648]